jgi:hypothetical protein
MQPVLSVRQEAERINANVTLKDVRRAIVICFLAWTFAVYDFILFANLLPVISEELGWSSARATGSAFINSLGQVGAIIGGALFTATLSAAGSGSAEQADAWIRSGLIWGCIPILLSAFAILFARDVKPLGSTGGRSSVSRTPDVASAL